MSDQHPPTDHPCVTGSRRLDVPETGSAAWGCLETRFTDGSRRREPAYDLHALEAVVGRAQLWREASAYYFDQEGRIATGGRA
jgi:hypothetical protein